MKKNIFLLLALMVWMGTTGELCTRPIVYGRNYYTQPRSAYFTRDKATVIASIQKVLDLKGYQVVQLDEEAGKIVSGWRPVTSDSHYFNLFGRRDFGNADGTYYQLTIDLFQEASKVKILIGTTIKSIVGPLRTSGVLEREIIEQLSDLMRAPIIEMNNVDVKDK